MSSVTMTGAPPAAPAKSHRGAITICVMLATIMQTLDTTIANVALPYMQGGLGATNDQINWVLTSYIVASAIAIPLTGWVETRIGRKRLFLIAVTGFTLTSMLCGMSQSLSQMVVFRLAQGVFGAPLVPLSQSVLLDINTEERRGSAMAIWGVGVMVGPILGPTIGGWLTETYNWRWVFYVNLPIGIITVLGLSTFLSAKRLPAPPRFDWLGFLFLSLGIGALQMLLDRGEQVDWFQAAEIQIETGLALLGFYLFVVHLATAKNPFIDPRVFKDWNFTASLVLIFAVGAILLASLALITPYLQRLMNYPVLTAGLVSAPRGMGTMAAMMLCGRIITRVDPRGLLLVGTGLTAFSLHQMAGFTPDVSMFTLIWTGVVQGMGLGFLFVPLSTMAFATLSPQLRTQGTALFSLLRNIGSSIGISVAAFLLSRNSTEIQAHLVESVTPFREATRHLPALWNLNSKTGIAALTGEVQRQAAATAYVIDFKVMTMVALSLIPLIFLLRRPRSRTAPAPAAHMD